MNNTEAFEVNNGKTDSSLIHQRILRSLHIDIECSTPLPPQTFYATSMNHDDDSPH